MRGVQNDAGASAVKFDDNIFHCKIAKDRGRMKVVLFDRAAVALELPDDVRLRAPDSLRIRRPRSDFDQMTDMLVSSRTVKTHCRCLVIGRTTAHYWDHQSRNQHGCSLHAFLVVRRSMRFSYFSPWKMASTKMPGVCTWSGGSWPGSTSSSTSATT